MKSSIKTIILIVSLFLIIVISGLLTLMYLIKTCDKLETNINAAFESVSVEQWDKAESQLKEFEEQWDSTKRGWAMLVDHFEIDNIDNSFTKAKEYIKSKDFSEALAELEALKHYIGHIPEKEGFSLKNILMITSP